MKYKYVGAEPALLIEHHIEVAPGDVVDVNEPINSVFFVPVDDEKKKATQSKEDAN